MLIHLHPPLAIYESGQRDGNEDCIYPSLEDLKAIDTSNLFVICDGVGGAAKGEVASRITCETFAFFFKNKEILVKGDIDRAVAMTEQAMDDFIRQHLDANGMATTIAMLFLHNEGVTIAHIGDSRVYQIRSGQIIFKTADHSLVNELLANNLITEEQAINHPHRNVISRAITGKGRPSEADTTLLRDIRQGDYFFLCSDGIIESFSDLALSGLLARTDLPDIQKILIIQETCHRNSMDNFSAFLLRVKDVTELHQTVTLNPRSSTRKKVSLRQSPFRRWR